MKRWVAALVLMVPPQLALARGAEPPPMIERPAIVEINTPTPRSGEEEYLEFLVELPYEWDERSPWDERRLGHHARGIKVRIRIFDARGRLMGTAVKTYEEDGGYIIYRWEKLGRLPRGKYVARLEANGQRSSRKFAIDR